MLAVQRLKAPKGTQLYKVLLFILPAMIPLVIFLLYPIMRTIWISFTNWDFMTPEYDIVFLKNYKSIFKDPRFADAMKNTLGTLVPTIVGVLGIAMLSVIIVTVWKGLGYTMIFYLSALEKVPAELYEACALDGWC